MPDSHKVLLNIALLSCKRIRAGACQWYCKGYQSNKRRQRLQGGQATGCIHFLLVLSNELLNRCPGERFWCPESQVHSCRVPLHDILTNFKGIYSMQTHELVL